MFRNSAAFISAAYIPFSTYPVYEKLIILPGFCTAWKVSKYRVISGPYFPVFSPNTGKYGPEITPYLDTFHAVLRWHWIQNTGQKN